MVGDGVGEVGVIQGEHELLIVGFGLVCCGDASGKRCEEREKECEEEANRNPVVRHCQDQKRFLLATVSGFLRCSWGVLRCGRSTGNNKPKNEHGKHMSCDCVSDILDHAVPPAPIK